MKQSRLAPHSTKSLYRKSNLHGLTRVLSIVMVHVLLLCMTALFATSWPVVLALGCLQGLLMASWFNVQHFAAHGTLFSSRRLNRVVGMTASLLVLQNFFLYKHFHMQHHRHTGEDKDSEPHGSLPSMGHYAFYFLNWDYLYAFWRMSLASLTGRFAFFVKRAVAREVQQNSVLLFVYMTFLVWLTYAWPHEAMQFYWIPLQIALATNFFLVLGEHYLCDATEEISQNTRSLPSPNKLFDFFYLSSNYHAEHHLVPSVPPQNIALVHKKLGSGIKHRHWGYFEFHKNVWKSLSTKQEKAPKKESQRVESFFYELKALPGCKEGVL